jgi:hypothetical protein
MRQQMTTGAELVAALEAGKYLKRFDPCDPRRWVGLYMYPREPPRNVRVSSSFHNTRSIADCLKDAVENPQEWFACDSLQERPNTNEELSGRSYPRGVGGRE